MPILTFPLALVVSTCFVFGCLLTWALQERRRRQEREDLEGQMARALQTRYEVYEGLEQTVVKLVTKFDAMENEFKQRLMQAGAPPHSTPSADEQPERGLRVRSSNPELWDLEREHHRVTSEQLAEIARRSTRITELMEQVQTLEPANGKLESELNTLRHRFENAIANAVEFEEASHAKVGRLEARVGELEPFAVRSAELETLLSERDSEIGDQKLRILELEGEFSGVQQALDKQRARSVELENRAMALERELADANAQIGAARGAQEAAQGQLETLKNDVTLANQRCEVYSSDLIKARASLDEVQARVVELESEFGRVQGELHAQQAREEQSGRELRAQLGASQARLQSSENTLEELRAMHAAQSAQANERIQTLSTELEQARGELTLHRAKLAAHSSHVVEAWSVLSELKPMLETLEQKLKDPDGPSAALPNKASTESNASAKSN